MQLWYDVVAHHDGWAISMTPGRPDAFARRKESFATKKEAFDAAAELARKLRFVGLSLHVRIDHVQRKAS